VKSKKGHRQLILVVSYLAIWGIALIHFWFFLDGADAMGYGLLYLWILLPVTTLFLSVLIGRNNYWGKLKWLSSIVFGVMYMLAAYATFSAANMVAFNKINLPDFWMILAGSIISLIGLVIGTAVRHIDKKRRHPQPQYRK
jgi:hypothetical protein